MNTTKLSKLVETILTLKAKLKCPICLDVIQQVVELDCGHKYCTECYHNHKSTQTQPSCPLCKKVLTRRSVIYTDNYANALGKFVVTCCENIESVYKCEVEQLQKQLREGRQFPLQNKENIDNKNSLAIPSTSKVNDHQLKDKKFTREKYVSTKDGKNKAKDVSTKENCESAFDKLMKAEPPATFNKKGAKRVYSNKTKTKTNRKVDYDVLEFDNHENKQAVLQWLNDTRNKFDRLSQTQNFTSGETSEVPNFDLASVSQIKGTGIVCSKPNTSKIDKCRAKSLDIEIKKTIPSQPKRQTYAGSVSFENYDIEEINTEEEVVKKAEEKVILDLIENEYLDTLEHEMQSTKKPETAVKGKKRTKTKGKLKELTPTTRTGWDRLTKIEKTIKRNEKAPKQLNITLQSTQEQKNEKRPLSMSSNKETELKPSGTDKQKDGAKEDIVEITDVQTVSAADVECIKYTPDRKENEKSTSQNRKISYDLEKVEDYFAKNIGIGNASKNDDSLTDNTQQHNKTDTSVQNCESKNEEKNVSSPEKHGSAQNENVITANENGADERHASNSELLDILFNMPTQRDQEGHFKIKEENEVVTVTDDDVPEVSSANKEKDASLDDEIARLYACPTQKIDHACKDDSLADILIEEHNSVEDLLFLFEACLDRCIIKVKSADKAVRNHLEKLKIYLSKLKVLHKNDNEIIKEKPPDVEFCDAATQVLVTTYDKTVQTAVEKNNVGVQTEVFRCHKCELNLKENKGTTEISQNTKIAIQTMMNDTNFKPTLQSPVPNKNNVSQSKQQNDIFTCTLDHLNFETQELTKTSNISSEKNVRKTEVAKVKEKPLVTEKIDKENGENIPISLLVCSLSSDKATTSKQVNRQLTYETDKSTRFKRIRPLDSDSEDEAPTKKKCNRFIRDDLSVEFLTNPEVTGVKKLDTTSILDSEDSEEVNYEEYLTKVMKKLDDDNLSVKTSSEEVLTPKRAMIKKCEEMIADATTNRNDKKAVQERSTSSSKDSFRTASNKTSNNLDEGLAMDEIFLNEANLQKLENDIREYEKNSIKAQNSEISDIIGETEEMEPSPKKRKIVTSKSNVKSSNVLRDKDRACTSKDQFDQGKKVDEIFKTPTKLKEGNKIKILANVKVKSAGEKEVRLGDEEDDLFSDEDIVETTPTKHIDSFAERSAHSQIMNSISLINNALPDEFEYNGMVLPPPHEFQDDIIPSSPEDTEDDNAKEANQTLINMDKSSLTPDHLSQFPYPNIKNIEAPKLSPYISHTSNKTEELNEKEKKTADVELLDDEKLPLTPNKPQQADGHIYQSTPIVNADLVRNSFSFSPIASRISQKTGLAEMAQAAKYTPLTTTPKQTPQKQNLLTSIPGQKSILNYVKPSESNEDDRPIVKTKPCIACTRLSKDQVQLISQLMHKKLATYNSQFDSSVTHMIINVNDEDRVKDYTIKFISAVAAGIWVLRFEWIEECLNKNRIVPEEPFEVLDISGAPGPKTARLTRKCNPLFRGYKFFCADPFSSARKEEIQDVLKMLDGKIVPKLRGLLEDDGNIGIIIAEGHPTQDFDQYERWVELYKTVTVDIEWMSKCIAQYKILSIRPFVWCSEDNLVGLGYPSMLTETVPFSFTETF